MTAAERAEVFALATDLLAVWSAATTTPADLLAVWSAATTTPADGQRVIRCLVERVTATVDKGTERVRVVIRWLGGCETGHDVRRPVGRYDQLSDLPALLAWIDASRADRLSLAAVAERLNAEGYSPPKRTGVFTAPMLTRLLASRRGRTGPRPPSPAGDHLTVDERWLTDLVRRLGVPEATAREWVRRGCVNARTVPTPLGRRWAV